MPLPYDGQQVADWTLIQEYVSWRDYVKNPEDYAGIVNMKRELILDPKKTPNWDTLIEHFRREQRKFKGEVPKFKGEVPMSKMTPGRWLIATLIFGIISISVGVGIKTGFSGGLIILGIGSVVGTFLVSTYPR